MAMIAMTTRSSMRVKPRERMVRSCGFPGRNGSLKRAFNETPRPNPAPTFNGLSRQA
jgi:hypothetical protein